MTRSRRIRIECSHPIRSATIVQAPSAMPAATPGSGAGLHLIDHRAPRRTPTMRITAAERLASHSVLQQPIAPSDYLDHPPPPMKPPNLSPVLHSQHRALLTSQEASISEGF